RKTWLKIILSPINSSKREAHMKVIHFILMLLVPCLTLAGGEGSGGSLTHKAFLEMSPELALASNKFRKRIFSIHFPGTSTWYNPANEICIEGNKVRTIR